MSTKWYLSGPMTGLPGNNLAQFAAVADAMRSAGFDVVNPGEVKLAGDPTWLDFMRADLALLLECGGIVMLPGWERSKGARIEHDLARGLGFWVLEANAFLPMASAGTVARATDNGAMTSPRSPALVHRATAAEMAESARALTRLINDAVGVWSDIFRTVNQGTADLDAGASMGDAESAEAGASGSNQGGA